LRAHLRAHATVERRLDAELREAHGLPLFSYVVLLHLWWAWGHRMWMGELAESVLLTLGGVTRLISRSIVTGWCGGSLAPRTAGALTLS
jgi:hypothetical protein